MTTPVANFRAFLADAPSNSVDRTLGRSGKISLRCRLYNVRGGGGDGGVIAAADVASSRMVTDGVITVV